MRRKAVGGGGGEVTTSPRLVRRSRSRKKAEELGLVAGAVEMRPVQRMERQARGRKKNGI